MTEQTKFPTNQQRTEDSLPNHRRTKIVANLSPLIVAAIIVITMAATCKLLIIIMEHTIGMSEEGKNLVYVNVLNSVPLGGLANLMRLRFKNAPQDLKIKLPNFLESKWIKGGILLGIVIYIAVSTTMALTRINEASHQRLAQAIFAVGLLVGFYTWTISVKILNILILSKRRGSK